VTFKDSRGVSQTYDLDHDMTANGALNKDLDTPSPKDASAVKSAQATKE